MLLRLAKFLNDRRAISLMVCAAICLEPLGRAQQIAIEKGPPPAAQLLDKIRARYDLPWARGLGAISCEAKMDWRAQFLAVAKRVTPEAADVLGVLEAQRMHLSVTPAGASVQHGKPDVELAAVPKAAEMQSTAESVLTASYGAWLPASEGVLFPLGPTRYEFESLDAGYKLMMNGADVQATLTLNTDLVLTGGTVEKPQAMRFVTEFSKESDAGLVLRSLVTNSGGGPGNDARFHYNYSEVDGFAVPTTLDTISANGVPWHFSLTACHVDRATLLQVAPGSLPRR